MPIPTSELNRRYLLVAASDTVAAVRDQLPARRAERAYVYVVWPTGAGRFVVVRWDEIEALARADPGAALASPIGGLPGLPDPVAAVEQDGMGIGTAREQRDNQPGRRLVVLARGAVIGLLTRELLGDDGLRPDPFATAAHAEPPATLSDDTASAGSPAPPAAPTNVAGPPAAPAADTRVINGWVPGVDATTPMQVSIPYELKFAVDQPRADAVVRTAAVGPAIRDAAAGQSLVTILVVLEPGDFTLYGVDTQEIVVPVEPNAASKNTVTFTIEAARAGANTLNAIFYIAGSVFQRITLTIQAGALPPAGAQVVASKAIGISLGSAAAARPAHPSEQIVNVVIYRKDPGYQVIVQGGGVARAYLDISTEAIADWVGNARKTLYEIVHLQNSAGGFIYQSADTAIAPEVNQQSLKKLAEAGALLYYNLFYNSSRDDARRMGDLLTSLSRTRQLNIQIVAERFFFPWAFLFDGDDAALANPSYEHFWGLKHRIEYLPEFTLGTITNFDPTISAGATVDLAFVCNNTIDSQFNAPIVQGQRAYLKELPGLSLQDVPTVPQLVELLRGPDGPQLIYFYCHAISKLVGEEGGVDASRISLTDAKTNLAELKIKTRSAAERLRQAPLVFLNACESAELSPFLYDGWVPFLLARGARGVLGTEVETPAFFAAEFAKEFLRRFTGGGVTLGELLRDMRVEYARDKHNIMGLLYALYSNGDVVIERSGV